jgi:WhiB family transcriptional regulator, redox-sensing transcriptional regulator
VSANRAYRSVTPVRNFPPEESDVSYFPQSHLSLVPSAGQMFDDGPDATSPRDPLAGLLAAGDESWRLEGLCAETDPEAFFPEKGGSTRDAKRVCAGCPVRMECLEYALGNDERFGIWGGLSERERRRVRLQRRGILSA